MLPSLHATCVAFCFLLAGAASAQYSEVEPNDTKAMALSNGAFVVSAGSTLTGRTTGSALNAPGALNSADYFLIETAPLPPGLYRHRITATSTQAHILTIRSTSAINAALDGVAQTSNIPTVPPRFVQWYGFGRAERIYLRVTGTTATTLPYDLTVSTDPVAVTPITGSFAPGPITLSARAVSTIDSEVHVYDANFVEIRDYQNDDPYPLGGLPFQLLRPYAAGTYHVAVSRYNQISTHPETSRLPNDPAYLPYPGSLGGEVVPEYSIHDFPNVVTASNTSVAAGNISFKVVDSTAVEVQVPASVTAYEIAWFRMEVGSSSGCTSPAIAASPSSLEVCYGNSASFTAMATGTEPLSYQWYWNGSPIPVGGNAATLSIPLVDFSYAGSYTCTVTNACGSATTAPALLLVHPAGPEITQHPAAQTLCVGETATFTVAATGRMHGGLEYQWMKDGSPILGATSATLSFVVSGLADGGSYLCRVNEPGCGSSDSSAAPLTVRNAAPTIALVGDTILNLECGQSSYVELGASVSDDCDQGLQVTIGGDVVDPHQLGHYVVTYDAVDSLGNPAVRVERHVFVVDTTPPVLTTSLATNVLWSPRHEMVNVGLAVQASDHCSPQSAVENVSVQVWCDEIELPDTGDGTGRHAPDAKDIAAGTLRLRSERRGWDNGRIYVIVVRTQDASGNTAVAIETVVCPSSQNQTALSTVQSQALSVTAQLVAVAGTTDRAEDLESALEVLGFKKHGLEAEHGPHQ